MALINYLTEIRFEIGAIGAISEDLAALGIERPFIVSDQNLQALGFIDRLSEFLPDNMVWYDFYEVPTNPTERAMEKAVELYKNQGCDGLIAMGGGSSIDLAKAVALIATHGGKLVDYAVIEGGLAKITNKVAPVIAIPTTAGTGSEVGRGSLMTLNDGRKLGILSPYLIPKRAICDPGLTRRLPPLLTAATGMDALTHCIETFLSPRFNPVADAIALDGAGRAWRHIAAATQNGEDMNARSEMMMASLQGGLTFQKGLGAVHSMSHPLGSLEDLALHHGTLNAVLLPTCLRFNQPVAEAKYNTLRAVFGLDEKADLAEEIENLVGTTLQLPTSLKSMGVPESVLPEMAKGAVADHSTATNPRPCEEHDFYYLFNSAMIGW